MRTEGRVAAAIGILDAVLCGMAAEQALVGWARAQRYAGSGDRAAVRDLVFDALRCLGSLTARAGAATPSGRALMIGHAVAAGLDPEAIFSGERFAPAPLSDAERAALSGAAVLPEARLAVLDCPDWILPELGASLGADLITILDAMRHRAPVFLRVNPAHGGLAKALAALAGDGIAARARNDVSNVLEVVENARKIKTSLAYSTGLVELQDLSPQAAVETLPLEPGMRALDYCAGGGGKTLALAARGLRGIVAHDANPARMADLPARAARAGADIEIASGADLAGRTFDLVLVDVPCSGTGTWRRTPDAKWRLSPERLADLARLQERILDAAVVHAGPQGHLAYMTCSLLDRENGNQVRSFLDRHPGWRLVLERRFTPLGGGDGFYLALLTRG